MADKSGWLSRIMPGKLWSKENDKSQQIHEYDYAWDGVTVSMMLGTGKRYARTRFEIYEKWNYMGGDAIISSALRLHVTQALGGHETTGDVVFIESTAEANGVKDDSKTNAIIRDIQDNLGPLLNRIAPQVAFKAAQFGDAYGRVYGEQGKGVLDVYIDELVYPPLVQPYEQANNTVGFVVSTGERFNERLTVKQMARMKMPRFVYTAQMRVLEKAARIALKQDDINELPIMPGLVGGSFLDAAEESYDNMSFALQGVVGQRVMGSIDETLLGVNLENTTLDQQKKVMEGIKNMLVKSKERTEQAVKAGKPVLERFYHVMPTVGEKQITSVSSMRGSDSGASNYSTEDIFLHARLLAGALGIDLTMLGFADQLSGGLGDGGFFRVSAQAAERSRIIRGSLTEFFHWVIDIHTLYKYGYVFDPGKRPYQINFYGSISALESEQQHTRETSTNSTLSLVGLLEQLKNLGTDEKVNQHILANQLGLDEDAAKLYADGVEQAKKAAQDAGSDQLDGGFGNRSLFANDDDEKQGDDE
jgi:hypothetical protein